MVVAIDLFCGCGGLTTGLVEAGIHVICGVDIWETAIETYRRNHMHLGLCDDIQKLDPKFVADMIEMNHVDIIAGGPPCFVEGTPVLTRNGYKPIESVMLDEQLMTHLGRYMNIVNLQRKLYTGEMHTIDIMFNPDKIKCTPEHPFYAKTRQKRYSNKKLSYQFSQPTWVDAKDISENHFVGVPVNQDSIIPKFLFTKVINQTTVEKVTTIIDQPHQWFMIGYFIGNGWLLHTKKPDGRLKYRISFAIPDGKKSLYFLN
jgi:hypothetical protein